MDNDKEKLKKLENKFKELEKILVYLKENYEFVMELAKKEYTPPHCAYFLFSFDKIVTNIDKIMKK